MNQENTLHLPTDDRQIIEDNQLGTPLAIYRQRQGVILLHYFISLFFLLVSMSVFLLIIVGSLDVWNKSLLEHQDLTSSYFQFLFSQYLQYPSVDLALFGDMMSLAGALVVWRIIAPQGCFQRIIVCKKGLLNKTLTMQRPHYQAIYWNDTKTFAKSKIFPIYTLSYLDKGLFQNLKIGPEYEDANNLIMQVRQNMNKNKNSIY